MPPNKGRTVQEHTASSVPETDATVNATGLEASGPQVAHHRTLADVRGHRTGNQEGRQQAQNDVLPGVPIGQANRLEDRIVEARRSGGNKVDQQKRRQHEEQQVAFTRVAGVQLVQSRGHPNTP